MNTSYPKGTLGWWMDERRGDLGLSWREVASRAGVSDETLFRSARGRPLRTTSRKGIERALQWDSGSIDAILSGGEPVPFESGITPDMSVPYEAHVWQEDRLTSDDKEYFIREYRRRIADNSQSQN